MHAYMEDLLQKLHTLWMEVRFNHLLKSNSESHVVKLNQLCSDLCGNYNKYMYKCKKKKKN